ncbi:MULTISPECIES: NAD(P)H:quinone oxidoreductase [Pseudonocardia]|uniref:NAD(P)H dehydrogenase (Quinone) n=3 Tax=Pseudonocardia TaxID=1847 RepID=A0A1I5HH71_PSUAM|nr:MULTISPECIES: NAD(P)H:quinone oxidoreductase [Pseudonocardia]OSY34400.1 NAD(P)H dehydrogenase (quinone) [Pseudonocardia autotrophica]TDN74691.1 NAD(P)H dehydrogenase (quinone) [Pseudonocardia autotrophica]SFO47698.1 NAD(P)H dehydrogenase (quinone) [Pseudonocardia ammonioxydans]BBG05464.1 TrpR-binding protein WrbA [Pseudonocardia autotrophica]GEC29775.1 TrpR-binding protein WrbA [Pseudonocardia saturnea]
MSVKVLALYYSATGNTAAMASALADGASETGAEIRLRQAVETAPQEAINSNPRWRAYVDSSDRAPAPALADLEWADGIALGSPTRFGGPAAQLKSFLDSSGGLWARGALANKVTTAFTTASTAHGGLESTVLAMNNIFYHWGSIVLPLGYAADKHLLDSGNPYGSSFVSRRSAAPDESTLEACRIQGRRIAQVAAFIAAGLSAESAA